MATSSDTLSLDGFRRERSLPLAAVEKFHHPEAVEAARARIASLEQTHPLENANLVPAQPTQKLITDRERLRKTITTEPTVVARPVCTQRRSAHFDRSWNLLINSHCF